MEGNFSEIDAKAAELRERTAAAPPRLFQEFVERLDFSWIYHDNALEGVVVSYHELKAALDQKIISDVSLIPMYEELKSHKTAIEWIRDQVAKKKISLSIDFLKKLHSILSLEESTKSDPYRKDNPLHRSYYHEISPPEKIAARLKKLTEWYAEEETKRLHPILRAARLHFKLMAIYPWTKNSGRVARLAMNALLLRDGYLPSIIHAIDRQRYYDSLRAEHAGLPELVADALLNATDTALKYLQEADALLHATG
jgi:Fic family protein